MYYLISPNPHISVNLDVKLGLPGNPLSILKPPFPAKLTQLTPTKQLNKTKIFFKVLPQPKTISVLQVNKMPHKGIEGTQHIVVAQKGFHSGGKAKTKEFLSIMPKLEVQIMNTSDFEFKNAINQTSQATERFANQLENEDDFLAGRLFENLNSTPLGRLLKIIASLPEIRQEKVVNARHRINCTEYETGTRLDMALDKVLEELIAES